VGVPGPTAVPWAFALLAWAALAVIVGELLRTLLARTVSLWRRPDPIERMLLDFYLGGALVYVVAAVPWSGFTEVVIVLLPVAAWVLLAVLGIRAARRPGWVGELRGTFVTLVRPVYLIVLLSAVGLFAVEVAVAVPIGSGNTFDSSLLTLYTSLLLQHHTIPLSFAPYASTGLLYPQGTTVWLGWAALTLAPPPARAALLVTPLFLALAPLAGFVFGRRVFGSEHAGLAMALLLAWVGPGTRAVVFGSNDFVFAFPLVLLLVGQSVIWLRPPLPRLPDVLAFGLLLGYSAAINPVGAEWLLLALPIAALFALPRFAGAVRAWFGRWAVAAGATLVGILPSLYVLVEGHSSPGFVPGATSSVVGSTVGIDRSQFFGFIDPFLFGNGDTELSSVAALRLELAVLLVAGLALLIVFGRQSAVGRYFEPFRPLVVGAGAAMVTLLAVLWAASTGFGPAVDFARISSGNELSTWLFAVYGLVATLPLVLALERFVGWLRRAAPPRSAANSSPGRRWSLPPAAGGSGPLLGRTLAPLAVALLIVVPGVVLSSTELPSSLSARYQQFGNVTAADFELFAYAGDHLPNGARVLVAPGSAGQFLPGYCTDIVLLYPMVPGWRTVNASYALLVRDLSNGTLDSADTQAIAALDVQYIVVTGNSTTLWPAFSPRPLLAAPDTYPEIFADGDAYLFGVLA